MRHSPDCTDIPDEDGETQPCVVIRDETIMCRCKCHHVVRAAHFDQVEEEEWMEKWVRVPGAMP